MIILPGSKNTMGDLKWMRQNGLEAAIKKHAQNRDAVIFGICGGYQMLGECITDPYGVEEGGMLRGMELLPMETEMEQEKTRTQVEGQFERLPDVLSVLSGMKLTGYEIHMGASRRTDHGENDMDTVMMDLGRSEKPEMLQEKDMNICAISQIRLKIKKQMESVQVMFMVLTFMEYLMQMALLQRSLRHLPQRKEFPWRQ